MLAKGQGPKSKFERKKPHFNIGTIGHVDHGKTTLTAAITRFLSKRNSTKFIDYDDIDRDPTERARGITINAARIEYETENRHYTHIDCPGHQDYIKNMILGTNQMDGVILVVAATEGPKVQTREHLIVAKEIGVKNMVVYCNKLDAVLEKEMIEMVELEIRDTLYKYNFDGDAIPIIFGSARNALAEFIIEAETERGSLSIGKLLEEIDKMPQPERNIKGPFLMAVEEVLSITGRGTVLTGKIERGLIKVGEPVDLLGPKKFSTTCTGLEMYRKVLDVAYAGENVGLLVRSISRKAIKRGYVVAAPNSVKIRTDFRAKAYFLKEEEGGRKNPIKSGFSPQFYFRTSNITGTILLDEEVELVVPGDAVDFEVKLQELAALEEGLRFTIREGTKTVGGGIITKVV
jgi:elongation factor Tu